MNELGMRAALLTHTPLAALIDTRLSPRTMPQGTTLPYITFFLISDPQTALGVGQSTYQFNVVSNDYTQALTTAGALTAALAKVEDAEIAFATYVVGGSVRYDDEVNLWVKRMDIRFDFESKPAFS